MNFFGNISVYLHTTGCIVVYSAEIPKAEMAVPAGLVFLSSNGEM